MEVSNCWKKVEFPKIPVKMKNCKTFYKTQTARRLKEIIYLFGTKLFWGKYTELYRHLLSKYFENGVFERQEMLQCKCFFWHQTERCLLENLSERLLAVLREHMIFNVKWVEVPKISEVVWAKVYCKMSDLFR